MDLPRHLKRLLGTKLQSHTLHATRTMQFVIRKLVLYALRRYSEFIPVSTLLRCTGTPTNDSAESFGPRTGEPHGPGQDSEVEWLKGDWLLPKRRDGPLRRTHRRMPGSRPRDGPRCTRPRPLRPRSLDVSHNGASADRQYTSSETAMRGMLTLVYFENQASFQELGYTLFMRQKDEESAKRVHKHGKSRETR